jgi:hypothetical protein
MAMLSEDDRDLVGLSDRELALAWDLWFDLAQSTNDADPPYFHGVFQLARPADPAAGPAVAAPDPKAVAGPPRT